ncbi:piggyBac transposable element-derived protein 3 [Trichonephila clavata]|uniref:PiggyBac transposable element-derived protein 3 n=1 Tax=Trichonephila clavata TaxID=2740835 RepID=A0A8X6M6M7_TRICU|nr:piggyBac transposable element-derived protein 3 [Trichonephila clavata]
MVFIILIKYFTDAEIQELLVQSDGELSDIDDPDVENIPESTSDFRSGLEMPVCVCVCVCLKLSRTECLLIDEQMMPFSGRCPPYETILTIEAKPCAIKKICTCCTRWACLDFLIYTGTDTVPVEDKQLYGLGGAVAKNSIATIPTEKVTHLFTDRYFTGLAILDYLVSRNVYLTGIVMTNRTDGVAESFPKDTCMERGSSVSRRREDIKACLVKWKDKTSVLLLSSAFDIKPDGRGFADTCKRYAKEQRQRVDVRQPAIERSYNTYSKHIL